MRVSELLPMQRVLGLIDYGFDLGLDVVDHYFDLVLRVSDLFFSFPLTIYMSSQNRRCPPFQCENAPPAGRKPQMSGAEWCTFNVVTRPSPGPWLFRPI